jgi:hypothetical protein
MTGAPDEMPTELADYAWVTPAEAWSMHDAIDARTGEPAGIVLGIRIGVGEDSGSHPKSFPT